jgi:hypothetical protein
MDVSINKIRDEGAVLVIIFRNPPDPGDHGVGSSNHPRDQYFFAKQVARLLKRFVAAALQPVFQKADIQFLITGFSLTSARRMTL